MLLLFADSIFIFPEEHLKDSQERRLSLVRKGDRASMKAVLSPDEKRDLLQKTMSSAEITRKGVPSSPTQLADSVLRSQFKKYKEQTDSTISELKETVETLRSQITILTNEIQALKNNPPSKSKKKR